MLETLWENRIQCVAVLLYAIGLCTLLLHPNLIKKIVGLNIMDSALCLFLTSIGYISGRSAPIITNGVTNVEAYVNPLPAGLVLTGIVVSVSVTALMLALTIRVYKKYRTLDLDHVYILARGEQQGEEGEG